MRKRQLRELVKLLDLLMEHEETVIKTYVVTGTNEVMPGDKHGAAIVEEARWVWKRANAMAVRLEAMRKHASA